MRAAWAAPPNGSIPTVRAAPAPGRRPPPMPDDPSPLDQAQRRLEAALARLEQKVRAGSAPTPDAQAVDERRRLESELRGVRTRERQLEQVAAEASAALGRAAAEVRAALEAEA